ncbi:hypothetical protein ACFFRR_011038 [Megaselia abdita]
MSKSIFLCWILLIINIKADSGHFDGCSVSKTVGYRTYQQFNLSTFHNNSPKPKEVIRTKLFFKHPKPYIGIDNGINKKVFGHSNNGTTFAIFKSHSDFIYYKNPCDTVGNVSVFSGKSFIEVDVILEKTGRMSVIIYGEHEFVLSCSTGFDFQNDTNIGFIISHTEIGEKVPYFYDCPF